MPISMSRSRRYATQVREHHVDGKCHSRSSTGRGCDRQTGKDVLNGLLRMFTDTLIDARHYGYRVSKLVTAGMPTTFDHVLPIDVVVEHLLTAPLQAPLLLQVELASVLRVAEITEIENRASNDATLRHALPVGWQWGDRPDARYKHVGINLEDAEREIDARIQSFIWSSFPGAGSPGT